MMRLRAPHSWDLSYGEAREVQARLAGRVSLEDAVRAPEVVTGVDVGYDHPRRRAVAVAISFRFPSLELLEEGAAEVEVSFPYVPGLLSFREGPAVLAALDGLRRDPDLFLFDAQGIAHPRGLGLASHMGVITGIPSIGVAKSRLVGEYREPGRRKGCRAVLRYRGKEVGRVVRTRTDVKALFVSPGHRVGLEGAAELVLCCCTRYRLPEPTRIADKRVKELRRGVKR